MQKQAEVNYNNKADSLSGGTATPVFSHTKDFWKDLDLLLADKSSIQNTQRGAIYNRYKDVIEVKCTYWNSVCSDLDHTFF